MIYIHDSFFNYDFTFKEDTNLTNNLSFITEKSKFYKEHPKGVEWVILKKISIKIYMLYQILLSYEMLRIINYINYR